MQVHQQDGINKTTNQFLALPLCEPDNALKASITNLWI